ncbi:hypothetical protein D9757_010378 [Collybiopsis confluens]|uniref:PEP-CTERM sorting domain-containing protein n=1 Tax=Collybiopsis confluens TaxID=2823264 RepID=A0A8H5LW34_9AGAR|nr:hypothetical protein D9757_012373 [Collybiopsis confluens]KAF5371544.1 hypothetical protein D9757_010378 [Collybiopsis confluens]
MLSLDRRSKAFLGALLGLIVLSVHTTEASEVFPPSVQMPLPTFDYVLDTTILFDANVTEDFIPGPFGDRAYFKFDKGNITDPNTGALVANFVPGLGGEFGIRSYVNGQFYVDATVVAQWADDGKFAYFKLHGIGSLDGDPTSTFYARLETDSPNRQDLVDKFLIWENLLLPPSASPPNSIAAYFKIFAKNDPDGEFAGYQS